ncbi:hypothetical protein DRH14_01275 [Candidatus Shapirobacteria bacterium]|nr:MAG: hypothetical protein DRH14_01275 [Candidatus Shapirobacteria bacterium]
MVKTEKLKEIIVFDRQEGGLFENPVYLSSREVLMVVEDSYRTGYENGYWEGQMSVARSLQEPCEMNQTQVEATVVSEFSSCNLAKLEEWSLVI